VSDLPTNADLDPIPLCEGSSTPIEIVYATRESPDGRETRPVRAKRNNPRRALDRVEVCLSCHDASGRSDHIDCPLIDISQDGVAVACDRRVAVGTRCYISYRTVSQQPVHVGGVVKNCARIEAARYRVGLLLDRRLAKEEQKPAKSRPGRSVSPTHHGRKLRGAVSDAEMAEPHADACRPVIREPSLGEGPDDYELTPE
jgi:PilZ domain